MGVPLGKWYRARGILGPGIGLGRKGRIRDILG